MTLNSPFTISLNCSSFIRSTSRKMTSALSTPCKDSASTGSKFLSTSKLYTFFATFAIERVRVPPPVPISTTVSSLVTPLSATIASSKFVSLIKFCPSALLKRKFVPCIMSLRFILSILFNNQFNILDLFLSSKKPPHQNRDIWMSC